MNDLMPGHNRKEVEMKKAIVLVGVLLCALVAAHPAGAVTLTPGVSITDIDWSSLTLQSTRTGYYDFGGPPSPDGYLVSNVYSHPSGNFFYTYQIFVTQEYAVSTFTVAFTGLAIEEVYYAPSAAGAKTPYYVT